MLCYELASPFASIFRVEEEVNKCIAFTFSALPLTLPTARADQHREPQVAGTHPYPSPSRADARAPSLSSRLRGDGDLTLEKPFRANGLCIKMTHAHARP
jgi:hypothetical protein